MLPVFDEPPVANSDHERELHTPAIAKRIAKLRKERGLTQVELANEVKVTSVHRFPLRTWGTATARRHWLIKTGQAILQRYSRMICWPLNLIVKAEELGDCPVDGFDALQNEAKFVCTPNVTMKRMFANDSDDVSTVVKLTFIGSRIRWRVKKPPFSEALRRSTLVSSLGYRSIDSVSATWLTSRIRTSEIEPILCGLGGACDGLRSCD